MVTLVAPLVRATSGATPKSLQAKGHLHDIWHAVTRTDASAAFDCFVETCGVKRDKAVARLAKDRDALPSFDGFSAEHCNHIRTSHLIESTFAAVRHLNGRTKGCLGRETSLVMAFNFMISFQKKWRKLDGGERRLVTRCQLLRTSRRKRYRSLEGRGHQAARAMEKPPERRAGSHAQGRLVQHRRLHSAIGYIPPPEAELLRHLAPPDGVGMVGWIIERYALRQTRRGSVSPLFRQVLMTIAVVGDVAERSKARPC